MKPLNIGFGNMVMEGRIIAIINPDSAPSKRLRDEAKMQNRLIDATLGRKTKTLIVTDSNHVIMSAINPETISARIEKGEKDE
ncbi:extracellular matrix/biofilm biosynthesis regulator RemA family protein [Fusobacterium sp.]|uniref:extracellular matrix/biofilm biosynthesis regulator RemA family protein n=1 Tax=Fusobacterium sp. TaxID=68766 RepID=UPI00396C44D1